MSKKLKIIFISAVSLLVIFIIFRIVKNKESNETPRLSSSSSSSSQNQIPVENSLQNDDTSFLNTLDYIRSMQIDSSLFISSAFKSLEDNTVIIDSNKSVGRVNPFSPIPGSQQIFFDILNESANVKNNLNT